MGSQSHQWSLTHTLFLIKSFDTSLRKLDALPTHCAVCGVTWKCHRSGQDDPPVISQTLTHLRCLYSINFSHFELAHQKAIIYYWKMQVEWKRLKIAASELLSIISFALRDIRCVCLCPPLPSVFTFMDNSRQLLTQNMNVFCSTTLAWITQYLSYNRWLSFITRDISPGLNLLWSLGIHFFSNPNLNVQPLPDSLVHGLLRYPLVLSCLLLTFFFNLRNS